MLMIQRFAVAALFVCWPAMAGDFPLACTYVADTPDADLESHPNCAAKREDRLIIAPDHLRRMRFSSDGLAPVVIDNHWYYIKINGDSLSVLTYDNAADDFSEGLTRSLVRNRVAYFDHDFHQVIPPTYDWGWPFKDGRALVCLGCSLAAPDSEGHRPVVGGKWGFIDKRGREVVPVTLTQAEAMAK
jgi:hypothetical protein